MRTPTTQQRLRRGSAASAQSRGRHDVKGHCVAPLQASRSLAPSRPQLRACTAAQQTLRSRAVELRRASAGSCTTAAVSLCRRLEQAAVLAGAPCRVCSAERRAAGPIYLCYRDAVSHHASGRVWRAQRVLVFLACALPSWGYLLVAPSLFNIALANVALRSSA